MPRMPRAPGQPFVELPLLRGPHMPRLQRLLAEAAAALGIAGQLQGRQQRHGDPTKTTRLREAPWDSYA
jgi:hypothetical protein